MNYLKLILRFWKLRRSKRITNLQADLYFYLIQECNERDWENPFECANGVICVSIGISEPSLIDARNRLQQLGLIGFKPGKRNECSPVYFIIDTESNLNNLSRNRVTTEVNTEVNAEQTPVPIKEQTKRKLNVNNFPSEPQAASAQQKKIVTEFWEKLVAAWFDFYGQRFKTETGNSQKPIFNKKEADHLKKICGYLKKKSIDAGKEWTEQYAEYCLRGFLQKSFDHDDWLKNNFELGNMLSKFNSITNSNGKMANTTGNKGYNSRSGGFNVIVGELKTEFNQVPARGTADFSIEV